MTQAITVAEINIPQVLTAYKKEVEQEWEAVLNYWMQYTVDEGNGGFYGSVNNNNIPDSAAPKGIVINCRILWAFSASYIRLKNKEHLKIAHRAFKYITDNFIDEQYGGVYWSVDNKGKMLDGKKQIYGLAFCIYGMSEYYKATKNEDALNICKALYRQIEKFSFDKTNGGYLEAFTREWQLIEDLRLSEKDDNEKKTMNTHLHIIEAYANLYSVWPEKQLGANIVNLLDIFEKYIINKKSFHLNLFMNEEWIIKSSLISFGHDIEAAWLLLECAVIIESDTHINRYKEWSVKMTDAAVEGLDKDGGLWYEYNTADDNWIKEKHSWPQAEAMVGFINAWQISLNEKYLHYSLNSWRFIKNFMLDKNYGEWFWGINEDYSIMTAQDKAGFWKCPYHNSRACMEVSNRINKIIK